MRRKIKALFMVLSMVSARSVDSEYNINPRKCKKGLFTKQSAPICCRSSELIKW